MTQGSRRGLLAIALAIAALTAAVATPQAGAVPRSFFGIVPQTQLGEPDYARMAQGRVGTVRVILNWSAVEQQPDVYHWTGYDRIVHGAARAGVTVLPFVFGTPQWVANGLDRRRCSGDACGLFAPKGKQAMLHWRDFIADAIARYGPNGSFFAENPDIPRKPIRAWQIWNEQNSKDFYRPKPSPKGYAKLLDQAAKAIRNNDPGADVVLGGMAEFRRLAATPRVIAGSDFLDRLYRAGGARRDFDGVAPHPYAGKVARVVRQTSKIRKIMRRHRDGRTGLWITELGWSSSRGGNPLEVGAKTQAKRLKQSLRYFKRRANRYNVKTVNWFSWVDSPTSICAWCSASGLLKPGLVEKPAWRAFVKFTGGS
ncbi:MAG: hypothetical protein ACRDK9_05050 [Solirubrobacterales bacterium]